MLLKLCLLIPVSIASLAQLNAQKNFETQLMGGMGTTHFFQSSWHPYRDQFMINVGCLAKEEKRQLAGEIAFFSSFGSSDYSSPWQGSDAAVLGLQAGVGKWWMREKLSAFITGGGLFVYSEYKFYHQVTNGGYIPELTQRFHAGIYLKSGADLKLGNKGLRAGPFAEAKIGTGQTKKELNLNISSFSVGGYIAFRKAGISSD